MITLSRSISKAPFTKCSSASLADTQGGVAWGIRMVVMVQGIWKVELPQVTQFGQVGKKEPSRSTYQFLTYSVKSESPRTGYIKSFSNCYNLGDTEIKIMKVECSIHHMK